MPGLNLVEAALAQVERPLLTERSLKLIGPEWRDQRRLISFGREALGPGPSAHLCRIAAALNAPAEGFALLDQWQRRAQAIHIGLEPETDSLTWKLYLEFDVAKGPEADVVFLALKWSGADWTHSFYRQRGHLPVDDKAGVLNACGVGPVLHGFLLQQLCDPEQVFLEITEPGTPRRSLDVGVGTREDPLGQYRDALVDSLGERIGPYVDAHASDFFSYVGVGQARDGQSFVAIYHGARAVSGALT